MGCSMKRRCWASSRSRRSVLCVNANYVYTTNNTFRAFVRIYPMMNEPIVDHSECAGSLLWFVVFFMLLSSYVDLCFMLVCCMLSLMLPFFRLPVALTPFQRSIIFTDIIGITKRRSIACVSDDIYHGSDGLCSCSCSLAPQRDKCIMIGMMLDYSRWVGARRAESIDTHAQLCWPPFCRLPYSGIKLTVCMCVQFVTRN